MSRTNRIWESKKYLQGIFEYIESWKCNSMCVFGHYRARTARKAIRHSIRVQNRCMFARNEYEPIIEIRGEYFD